jgi:hypothetical protein
MGKKKYKKGWQCPICTAVMNPKENICVNCKGLPNPVYLPKEDSPPEGTPYTGRALVMHELFENPEQKQEEPWP